MHQASDPKDGFLATHSLIMNAVLLARVAASIRGAPAPPAWSELSLTKEFSFAKWSTHIAASARNQGVRRNRDAAKAQGRTFPIYAPSPILISMRGSSGAPAEGSSLRKYKTMPFAPGKSGNPGGRPQVAAGVRELARKHTRDAVTTLAELMNGAQSEQARIMAANSLLDRGWGKPTQTISGDENVDREVLETACEKRSRRRA
jgi:hypothetical protein